MIDSELKHKWFHTIDDVDTSDVIDTTDWGISERGGYAKLFPIHIQKAFSDNV